MSAILLDAHQQDQQTIGTLRSINQQSLTGLYKALIRVRKACSQHNDLWLDYEVSDGKYATAEALDHVLQAEKEAEKNSRAVQEMKEETDEGRDPC